jgi:hypothetical protein
MNFKCVVVTRNSKVYLQDWNYTDSHDSIKILKVK